MATVTVPPTTFHAHLMRHFTHEQSTAALERALREPGFILAATIGAAVALHMPLPTLIEQLGTVLSEQARADLEALYSMFGIATSPSEDVAVAIAPPPPPPPPIAPPPPVRGLLFGGAA